MPPSSRNAGGGKTHLSFRGFNQGQGAFSEVMPVCVEGGAAAPKVTVKVTADGTMMDEDTRWN